MAEWDKLLETQINTSPIVGRQVSCNDADEDCRATQSTRERFHEHKANQKDLYLGMIFIL